MRRNHHLLSWGTALLAATLLVNTAPEAASAATDRSSLKFVEYSASSVVAYKNTGRWSFTVENRGTGTTAAPVTLRVTYNALNNDDHPHPRLEQAWSRPTVSSPDTKRCTIDTTSKKKSASCVVPALRPGQRASITVTARAEASPRDDVSTGWAFAAIRGTNDPDSRPITSGVHQVPLIGKYETATAEPGGMHVSGWVGNPISPDTPFNVRVYVNGKRVGGVVTRTPRPDVADPNGVGPNSGFDAVFPTTGPGKQTFCLVANGIGYGSGEVDLGCKTREFAPTTPDGELDVVSSAAPNTVRLTGWATDDDALGQATTIRVMTRGAYEPEWSALTSFPADQVRPGDQGRGAHGFDRTIEDPDLYLADGVCVVAVNVGAGSDRLLGCRDVSIAFGR